MRRRTVAALSRRARSEAGRLLVDSAFRAAGHLGRLHPRAHPALHGVQLERDIPYTALRRREHLLDVYCPRGPGPHPIVVYVHGGAFRMLSKDSHWVMGLSFARAGYLVFNLNYRLAPRHPYPAALEDLAAAWQWIHDNARHFAGDRDRVVVSGESAGGNLATALTIASCFHRPEPFAQRIFHTPMHPRAAVIACGALQVSDGHRHRRRRQRVPSFIEDRVVELADYYLRGVPDDHPGGVELADPLLVLERASRPARPLPATFAFAGTRDILLDDTRRLGAALQRLGAPNLVRFYPGELHAFHALAWRPQAMFCWQETFDFLACHLSAPPSVQVEGAQSCEPAAP